MKRPSDIKSPNGRPKTASICLEKQVPVRRYEPVISVTSCAMIAMCRPLKPRDKKRVHTWMTSYRRTLHGRLFVAAPVAFTVREPVPLLPLAFESFDTSGIEFVYMLFTVVSTRQLAGLRCGSLDEYSSDSFVLQMLQMMRTDAQGNCKSYKCGDGF